SKEDIYTEIRATAIRDAIARLEPILARRDPPSLTLRDAVHDLVSHIFDDLDRFANVLRADRSISDENRAVVRDLQRRYQDMLRSVIAAGVATGEFARRDPTVMTFTLLRACLGVAEWYRPDGPLPPDRIVEQVTEQVVAGVLNREETLVSRRGAG